VRAAGIARSAGVTVVRLPIRSASGLLDRALRGRGWIALIGALLVGIVFLNVSLLELNGGIAATSEQAAEVRRENADLRAEVATLGSSERIQALAQQQGFRMPAPSEVTYVRADAPADADRAARALASAEAPIP